MVSIWSIIFMAVSLLVCLMLTFGLFFILRKRLGLKAVPMLVGAAGFVVFALVLEQILHVIVLKPAPDGSIELRNNPLLYVLYGTMAAGVFEETARFLGFKLLKKKYPGVSTGLSHGIGHGGIEVLLLAGLSMVSSIVMSVMINAGMSDVLSGVPQMAPVIEQLTGTAPWMFAMSGVERIIAMAVQVSLSVVVWHSVNTKGKVWLYPLAIILHALVDVAPAMYQCGVINSILLVEAVTAVAAAALVAGTVRMHRRIIHNA